MNGQHRRANSSGHDSAVYLHLKEKNQWFEDNNVNILWSIYLKLERPSLNCEDTPTQSLKAWNSSLVSWNWKSPLDERWNILEQVNLQRWVIRSKGSFGLTHWIHHLTNRCSHDLKLHEGQISLCALPVLTLCCSVLWSRCRAWRLLSRWRSGVALVEEFSYRW